MLLSSLWDEIVADDMIMFSVGVMKLLICNVLLKLNSKSYHVVEDKRIIYDAIWKLVTKGIRRFSFFFLTMSRVNDKRVGENGRKRHVKISLLLSTSIQTLVKSTLAEKNSRSEHFSVPFPYERILE